MRELTIEERDFFNSLLKYSQRLHNGYYIVAPGTKRYGKFKYKVHRLIFQLHFNVKLEIWEIVHHKDGNKLNNLIDNLELNSTEKHTSDHHAGKRRLRKI